MSPSPHLQLLSFVGTSSSLFEKLQEAITDLYINTNNPDFCTLYCELLFSLLESDTTGAVRHRLFLFTDFKVSATSPTSLLCVKLNDLVSNPRDAVTLSQLDAAVQKVLYSRTTTTFVINPSGSGKNV